MPPLLPLTLADLFPPGLSLSLTIPFPDLLNSQLSVTSPFSWYIPSTAARRAQGRSLQGHAPAPVRQRRSVYTAMERYLKKYTGAPGRACLLRAICEVNATPDHDDGLLGDAVNLLLSASHALRHGEEEADEDYKEYLAAEARGHLSGDCTKFESHCPHTFFSVMDVLQMAG